MRSGYWCGFPPVFFIFSYHTVDIELVAGTLGIRWEYRIHLEGGCPFLALNVLMKGFWVTCNQDKPVAQDERMNGSLWNLAPPALPILSCIYFHITPVGWLVTIWVHIALRSYLVFIFPFSFVCLFCPFFWYLINAKQQIISIKLNGTGFKLAMFVCSLRSPWLNHLLVNYNQNTSFVSFIFTLVFVLFFPRQENWL